MKDIRLINTGRSIYLVLSIIFIFSQAVFGQPEYRAGTSRVSIEPDKSLISLHLGGYGAPRDGRFTLQWTAEEYLPEISAITGTSDRLFIISNGVLLFRDLSKNKSGWQTAGKAENIRSLAILDDKIYGVDSDGNFFQTKSTGKVKWKKSELPDIQAISLTISGTKLFALDKKGIIWQADLSDKVEEWTLLKSVDGIISLAADNRKLYALTGEDVIFQCDPGRKEIRWLKAAYRNNFTITEDMKLISIAGNTMYGISNEGHLYSGGHRSEGNLTVRAMAVQYGEKTVVIINADICGLNDKYTGILKKEILKIHNLPASAIFINSSHTHFAPVSQEWLTWQEANQLPDSLYLYSTVRTGILNSVDKALASLAPARLFFGRGSTDIGYNRSLKEHPELYDGSVDVIKLKFTGSNTEEYLFLASCHPVFSTAGKLNYTISANYPGVARNLVEERTGALNSLFLQGTAGDINPRDNGEYISGEKLANEVIAVINKPMTELKGGISYFLDTINIPVIPWTKDIIIDFRQQNSSKPGDIYAEKNVKWCDLMLKYYDDGTMADELPVYVHTINIGNWKLVGFSRETTTGYGFGVKNLWPDKLISVAGYTNDVSSYLPTSMHIEAQTYEGLDSFFWYGMPAVFPATVDKTILSTIKTLER